MDSKNDVEMRFRRGQSGAIDLQRVVDEVIYELGDPSSEASEKVREIGLDPNTLSQARISVIEENEGVEPISTTILVSIAVKVGAHAAQKFWDEVIWPRIRRRLGGIPIGEGEKGG